MKGTKGGKVRKSARAGGYAIPGGTSYGVGTSVPATPKKQARGASKRFRHESTDDLFSAEAASQLAQIRDKLRLNQNEVAALFGVTRQAVDQWSAHNVPVKRLADIDRLHQITVELAKRFKRQRLPYIVRGRLPILTDRSILRTLATEGVDPIYELFRRWDSYVPGGEPIRPGDFAGC